MKLNDFIFRYWTGALTCAGGICRVRTFLGGQNQCYVVLTELDENPSTSVTNALESIVEQLQTQQKIPLLCQILEHYPRTIFASEFDLVSFSPEGVPSWKTVSSKAVLQMLGCGEEEFGDYKKDRRVQKEIRDALLGVPKIQQFHYTEDPAVTERRLEIERSMHSLKAVKEFLSTNPSESELSAFLRQDMSLLAEVYAYPREEYICFAEFPVGRGRADFALFTGCSRMSVYLIEIKGAKQPLRRKNHYGDFRTQVQEGRAQLVERKTWCERNYEEFRTFVHRVLQSVKEEDARPYHAFAGPRYRLEVDPNKDIELHYVLLAGRTDDTLGDSQKRHQEDEAMGFSIRTETWDSWANKLRRE